MVVFIVPDPGLLLVEGKALHHLKAGGGGSELGLQVDIKDDTPNSDPMGAGCALERQQMVRHRFEIYRV